MDSDSVDSNSLADHRNDKKCSIHKTFEDYSCISLDILIKMAEAYNRYYAKKKIKMFPNYEMLNPKKYKKYLVKCFKKIFKNVCDDQICWTKQPFIKEMEEIYRLELEKFTFRPVGPNGQFDWLNTYNINDVMIQLQAKYKDFLYLGTVPIDFFTLPELGFKDMDLNDCLKSGRCKLGVVFNLDESWKKGSHWVALFSNLRTGEVYFFDSYGSPPERRIRKLVRKFANFCIKKLGMKQNNLTLMYNKTRHQYKNSECGVYALHFINNMLENKKFLDLCKNIVTDEEINKLRDHYFIKT